MALTSPSYLAFLLLAFLLYWSLPSKGQKVFLLLVSYAFYCLWKWEYGFLLLGVSLFNWAFARWVLPKTKSSLPMVGGILVNLLPLLYYKYTVFLVSNLSASLALFGWQWHPAIPNILLPLGISFFTFQGISYVVDVALGDEPYPSLFDFLLYMAFWPKLIAGPIVRAGEMRDQLREPRTLDATDLRAGCGRILLGLFKKIVVADTVALLVDRVFNAALPEMNAMDATVGIVGYGVQIFFDFSAYSDIAIGSARLFGYRLPENFDWPYFARSPQEFWTRWHITLSRWLRDYMFTPLSLATRRSPKMMYVWFLVVMALCGLWHGATWLFVLWGVWHGLLLALSHFGSKWLFPAPKAPIRFFSLRDWVARGVTFLLVSLGWVFFRAQTLPQAWGILQNLFTLKGGWAPAVVPADLLLWFWVAVAVLFAVQAVFFFRKNADPWLHWPVWIETPFYVTLVYIVLLCVYSRMGGSAAQSGFIYFNF